MEKPHTGLNNCLRMLQACLRKRWSVPEQDVEREGVGGDLCSAVQEEVDHDAAAQVARVEREAVVHERVGEPVEVEDQRLLGHVGGLEQGQQVGLRVRGFCHRFQMPVVGVCRFAIYLK